MKPSSKNLIWIDLEMTGLDVKQDHIIEIATVVTDTDLNVLAEGPVLAINQSEELLDGMDDWNTTQHNKSGLVERVKHSQINDEEAEAQTLEFLMHYVPCGKSPICGSTIYQDRKFLYKYMPKLEQYFHYRNLDVSTLKILCKNWAPEVAKGFRKKTKHLALSDIHDSISELRFYRDNFLKIS